MRSPPPTIPIIKWSQANNMGNIKIYTSVIQGGYGKIECDNDPLSILLGNIELSMPLYVGCKSHESQLGT